MKIQRLLSVPALAGLALTAGCLSGQGSGGASAPLELNESSPLPTQGEVAADAETAITAENADDVYAALKAAIEADLAEMDGTN